MTEPSRPAFLTVGEALVDVVVPWHDVAGRTDKPGPQEFVGGSPANVAIGLAALGHPSRLTAYLGKDPRGDRVRDHLARSGVRLTPGSDRAPRTPTATARLDPDGVADYDFDLAWDLAPQDLDGVGHLHTGSVAATLEPGGGQGVDLMARARFGATVSYDPNCRPGIMGRPEDIRGRIEECVGRSDVVKASLEDVEWLYPGAEPGDVLREWGRLGPCLVLLTRGPDGPLLHLPRSGMWFELPSRTVPVVDTVGAGDSFMSGLLSGLADGDFLGSPAARERLFAATPEGLSPALDRAVATASWTVGRAGAAAPTRADLGAATQD
ncbi:carbohydrate kinase family protein [Ornithinimicrobium panacihumi]|uniref:carbohydrate kinase family protein n=1 Tax=Ornithinimicrobium panacihumi TaxID=2008449 RepID=UPI003F8BBE13